jgi:hypothetical protein
MAIIVRVGFWHPMEVKQAPSATKTFLALSHHRDFCG